MKRIALIVTAVVGLVACDGGGDDDWKPECSDTKPCAAGSYCAETPDGNVCWPDSVAPVVTTVRASCGSSPCRRDATLRVEVEVTDDVKVGSVEVELGFDPPQRRVLQKMEGTAPETYETMVSLVEIPFPHFERTVPVAVRAKDEAGNEVAGPAVEPIHVTREAWPRERLTTVPLWSPAVTTDGDVVVAGTDGRLYVRKKDGTVSSVPVLTSPATAPVALNGPAAIGSDAIWAGSQDGRLYALGLDGTILASCNLQEPAAGAPVISGARAVSATMSTFVAVADAGGSCNSTVVPRPGQPVVDVAGSLFIPSSGKLRSFSLTVSGALADRWMDAPTAPNVGYVINPPAIAGDGSVWTANTAGSVYLTSPSGIAQQVPASQPLSGLGTAPIILADGSAVLNDDGTNTVRRIRVDGSSPWTENPIVDGYPSTPLALSGEISSLLVSTGTGHLHLVSQDGGRILWSAFLTGVPKRLESPNIWTEPGATTSTALITGADGYLYGVIVDGKLDTSAPWPKAYHDPQNTSNTGN